jgi:hypothetical protein
MTAPKAEQPRTVASPEDLEKLFAEMLAVARLPAEAKVTLQLTIEKGARFHCVTRTATVKG